MDLDGKSPRELANMLDTRAYRAHVAVREAHEIAVQLLMGEGREQYADLGAATQAVQKAARSASGALQDVDRVWSAARKLRRLTG